MTLTPQEQSNMDRTQIAVRLIENGILIRVGIGWVYFLDWEKASTHIAARLEALRIKRNGGGH